MCYYMRELFYEDGPEEQQEQFFAVERVEVDTECVHQMLVLYALAHAFKRETVDLLLHVNIKRKRIQ